MNKPIIFKWNPSDFQTLIDLCKTDPVTPFIEKYLLQSGKIVEAGCGLGRFVAYFFAKGYDIDGIEIGEESVRAIKRNDPRLNIIKADLGYMPYKNDSISGVISLGVVEHFIDGLEPPLGEIYRVLMPNHYAVITVPSLNLVRKLKHRMGIFPIMERLKRVNMLRKLFNKKPISRELQELDYIYKYVRWPDYGEFFEYRLTQKEFEKGIRDSGFVIVESKPIMNFEGLYYEFGRAFVHLNNFRYIPNYPGRLLNQLLSTIPFCHNHMHLCVVRK